MSNVFRLFSKAATLAMAIGVASAGLARDARATEIDFRYVMPSTGNVLSGTIGGILLSNGNDLDVLSVDSLFVNGVAAPPATTVLGADAVNIGGGAPPEITLDGSYLDLFLYDGGSNTITFAVGDRVANADGAQAWATAGYGGSGKTDAFVPADWSASLVPEPGSAALLLAPAGLLASVRARRRGPGGAVRWS
jgi:hypothetical protein